MSDPEENPASSVYADRISALQLSEKTLQRKHIQLGYLRLAIGIAVLVLIFRPHWYLLLAIGAFVLAARAHEAVLRRLAATRRTIASLQHATARVEDRWIGLRPRTPRADVSQSLYAGDLDLFGAGSLFELLCEARTSLGENVLAAWLLQPGSVAEALQRQQAVQDLRDRLHMREAFAAARGPLVAVLDAPSLAAWAELTLPAIPGFLRWVAPGLVALTLVAAWRSAVTHLLLPITVMLLVNACVTVPFRTAFRTIFAELQDVKRKLATTADLFEAIEREAFQAPALQAIQQRLHGAHRSAAKALGRLAVLSTWSEARGNYLVRILDVPLLYSLQLALALQRWKKSDGAHLRSWLESLGEFEALLSLGAYSYEHPEDSFPQFEQSVPTFVAEGLAHPLLPSGACVRNDLALSMETRLLLISGSNMSGKSTLLRAVGVNAVFAFAGAPVRARHLRLSALTLAASIQVNDSLQAGRSRFYAEILRLRGITQAARAQPPVLFLLDELLAGTNSTDRLVGAEAIVRDLLCSVAIGLLTTHDLALTSMVAPKDTTIQNAHFEDQIADGELSFDYKLRDGVVERSNGIALMRLVGLDV